MKKMIVCIIGTVLIACASSKDTDSGAIILDKTNITDKTQGDFDLSALVKDWDFVVPEQNDVCALTRISQIKISGNDIFVVNVEGTQSDIYHFTSDGKFCNRVGQQGIGYDFVINILVDSVNRKVCLLDIFERSIHHYDYNGNYQRSYKPYPSLQYVADVFCLGDNEILGYYGICQDHHLAYFSADSLLNMEDTLSYYQVSFDSPGVLNFSKHAVSSYGGRTLLIQPFCDTIFEYQNSKLWPVFITKVGASLPENYKLKNHPDCVKTKDQLEKEGYYSKSGIFETNSHIWIGYGKNRLMYNKDNNAGVYFTDSMHCHAEVFPPLDFIGRKKEALVTLVSDKEVRHVKEMMIKQGIKPTGKLKELFEIAEGEPYVLCFYTF